MTATLGLQRHDVGVERPALPLAEYSGWIVEVAVPVARSGVHSVTAVVEGERGTRVRLGPKVVELR